jgi:SpoVK/Ycf46/Vps4 family AAA+-type ATPase
MIILHKFDNGSHICLEKKLLQEMKRSIRKRMKSYEFTDEGLIYFLGSKLDTIIDNNQSAALIAPEELETKELFFDGEQNAKLKTLTKLLAEGKFEQNKSKVAKHFKGKGGISILLHGAPGTGKTEFVNQLAKQSNRYLFKVDLADTKSMWYGESERLTKKIFMKYKQACKKNGSTPILFINEADGLFSKRLQVERSIEQTSNTIQNIILEEMEQFEGILIATTNLMMNLDAAFDRRFLMKIKFELPGVAVRQQVWKSILPSLPCNQASLLAERYTLSPAQIDNVARKMMLRELVGESSNEFDLYKLCEDEAGGEAKRMGFC